MNDPDIILFNELKKENREAFNKLFRIYYSQLRAFAWSFLNSKELADEVVQESFIYIWSHAKQLSPQTSVRAYLFRMVRNRSLNILKSDKIRDLHHTKYMSENNSKTSESAADTDLKAKIQNASQELPEKCRLIFNLSKIEGLTYDEISDYLEISKKTIENQMTIAFKKLREILKK